MNSLWLFYFMALFEKFVIHIDEPHPISSIKALRGYVRDSKKLLLSVALITKQQPSVWRLQPPTYTEQRLNWVMPCPSR